MLRVIDGMNAALAYVVGSILATMVVIVAFQVVVRFVLPWFGIVISAPWSEELARYLLVWCMFLGAAVATRKRDLIAMDTVPNLMRPEHARIVRSVGYVLTIGFLLLLVWLGLRWTDFGAGETSTVMSIPMTWVYAAMPVGSAISAVNIVARLFDRRALLDAPSTEAELL